MFKYVYASLEYEISANEKYLLLSKDMSTNPSLDQTKSKALVDFIAWAITDGQT
jgi:phosphate transport system substrate-binding protein